MDNKFDLKKFLAENKGTTVSESTELVKGKNFTFNRFAAGDGKMGLQISNNSKIGEYIHVPGELLGEFGIQFEKAREVFDDTERQLPITDDYPDFTDKHVTDDETGEVYVDDENMETGEPTKPGGKVLINGELYRVTGERRGDNYRAVKL